MYRPIRTSIGIAAYLAMAAAHSATLTTLNTGGYVLASRLAAPGSFEAASTAHGAGDRHDSHPVTWASGVGPIAPPFGPNDEARGVHGVAIAAPVPEPHSYALMVAGLGVLGFLARRRKPALE